MRRVALFTLGAVGFALPAGAQVVTIGTTDARRCYLAAAAAQAPTAEAREACDVALLSGDRKTRVATHVNRGILRLVVRDVNGALSDFDAAIALDAQQPEAWLNKGAALVRAGRSEEAVPVLDRALSLNTRRPAVAHFVRAYAHEDTGKLSSAYRDLQTAAALSPAWDAPRRELKRYRVRRASGGGAGQGAL